MSQSFLVDQMTWSYSRLTCYEACPYQFFLRYIAPQDKLPEFFSSFGGFVHEVLARFYRGELTERELPLFYVSHYHQFVEGRAPTPDIAQSFYHQGLEAMQHPWKPDGKVLAVERELSFQIDGKPFTGFVDLLYRDRTTDCLVIVDHKSHPLKPRSNRKKPTKGDEELDAYLRQLYLYAEGIHQEDGEWPDKLIFNSYRTQTVVEEPFVPDRLEKVKDWALHLIGTIREEDAWNPDAEFFKCKHLCDVHQECDWRN